MIKHPTEFPNVGSYARLRGNRGTLRIQRKNDDGTLLVTGPGVGCGANVNLDSLIAARAPRA